LSAVAVHAKDAALVIATTIAIVDAKTATALIAKQPHAAINALAPKDNITKNII